MIEYVGHLHEHFLDPVEIRDGRYVAPRSPGFGAQMHERSIADHRFPDGRVWRDLAGADALGAPPVPAATPDGAVASAGSAAGR